MSSLVQQVKILLSKPHNVIKFNELRQIIKQNENELGLIKLSGKGRTKKNIIYDLEKWIVIKQTTYPMSSFVNSSELISNSNNNICDNLLPQMETLMDEKFTEFLNTLLPQFGVIIDQKLPKAINVNSNDDEEEENIILNSISTLIKILFIPIRIIFFPIRFMFAETTQFIYEWSRNTIFAPIKWVLYPLSIVISLKILLWIIQSIGQKNLMYYTLWSAHTSVNMLILVLNGVIIPLLNFVWPQTVGIAVPYLTFP
eukprot:499355_1